MLPDPLITFKNMVYMFYMVSVHPEPSSINTNTLLNPQIIRYGNAAQYKKLPKAWN